MRKALRLRYISAVFVCVLLACFFSPFAHAQQTNVTIRVGVLRVVIEGTAAPSRVWSFRNDYAGISELAERIEGLELFDAAHAEILNHKIAPGQFEAIAPATKFRYEVNLSQTARGSEAARMSWLSKERGLLMLGDLLPMPSQAVNRVTVNGDKTASPETTAAQPIVHLLLPQGWAAYSNESQNAAGDYAIRDAEASVFVIGNHLRPSRITVSGMTLNFVSDGEWAFADNEVLSMAADVLKTHHAVFDSMPSRQATLILLPLNETSAADKWSAETRGWTVTLLLSKQPSKIAALAQLSVPLAHELFHLWIPNGVRVNSDYDWFYEGFTVYQAARTDVRLGLLTFQEFLTAIGRTYDAYENAMDRDRWSLVEASQRRWTTGESVVYRKSMLVAFLYDLKLRSQSHGKRSLDDVYREFFRLYRLSESDKRVAAQVPSADGSDAVIAALAREAGMRGFPEAFIRHPIEIDLPRELSAFGIEVQRTGLRTHIVVREPLTRQQRDLLRELGYNDYLRPTQRKHG